MPSSPHCKIYEFPIKETHQQAHRRMKDNLLEILTEFNELVRDGTLEKVPTMDSGDVNWNALPIATLISWTLMESSKVSHDHEEETDNN